MIYLNSDDIWVAFHKGYKDGDNKRIITSTTIKLFTWSKYSHVELIFPEWVTAPDDNPRWFSSRGMDEPRGVSFKDISMSHPDRWDCYKLTYIRTPGEVQEIYNVAKSLVGQGYDLRGVLSYFGPGSRIRRRRNRRNASDDLWWCSEAVAFVLSFNDFRVCPGELDKMIRDRIKKNKQITTL